jgi:hypothetical protein
MRTEPPESLQDGRYERRRRIGAGSYGDVWAYHDRSLDRAVAIKFFRRGGLLAGDEEARRLARVQHRNIVPIHDVLTWDGQPLLVMELVLGATLQERISAGRVLSADTARSWIGQLASALRAIHGAQFVHCDFHPGNIIQARTTREYHTDVPEEPEAPPGTEAFPFDRRSGEDDYPVVLDFGVSRLRGDREQPALVAPLYRTPEWPEQDRLGDWYQLGLIAVQLLAGVDLDALVARAGIALRPPTEREKRENILRVREVALAACARIDDPAAQRMVRTLLADVGQRRGSAAVSEWCDAAPAPRRSDRRRGSRRVVSLAVLAAAVPIGVGVGWAAGGPQQAKARSMNVVAGPVRAALPATWRQDASRAPTKIAGRSVTAGAALSYPLLSSARLEFGLLRRGERAPTPERLVAGQRPVPARIGSLDGFRFADAPGPSGTEESVFAVATSAGYVLFRCRAAMADLAAFKPVCRGLIGAVAISGAQVEPPGPDAGYARFLNGRLTTLARARRAAAAGLAHRSMADRQVAAASIARAYDAFSRALATRTLRLVDHARSGGLQDGLGRAATAYDDLAVAARRHDRHAYARAAAAVRAQERRVGRALDDQVAGGYERPSGAPR